MKIIYSAYFCNPYWPSESMAAFKWLTILLQKFEVIIFTSEGSAEGIHKYYLSSIPNNLKILTFKDDNLLKRKFKAQLHFGYFTYNNNVRKYIKKRSREFDDVNLILHKNPTSFRYFTSLYKLKKPLVIGPVTGGLQVPKQIKGYFKSESALNKLRVLDQYLLRLPIYKKQYEQADKILITLDYLRDLVLKKLSSKIVTLFDGGINVDIDFLQRKKNSKTVPIRILWAGIMARYKGLELLVRAIDKIRTENIVVDVAGDGFERLYIESLIKQLELTDKIILHGKVPFEKMSKFYEEADIFCFPTLTEASGNVFLEAMKYSLPIVTIDNGGPRYMCPSEGTFKIPITSVDDIVDKISEKLTLLINSADLREKMGKVNYDHCKATYTWDNLSKNILALVEEYR
jgi:glycosyltransferase involved in cell wall biosynthesis